MFFLPSGSTTILSVGANAILARGAPADHAPAAIGSVEQGASAEIDAAVSGDPLDLKSKRLFLGRERAYDFQLRRQSELFALGHE
jgi:hypothetical protein